MVSRATQGWAGITYNILLCIKKPIEKPLQRPCKSILHHHGFCIVKGGIGCFMLTTY